MSGGLAFPEWRLRGELGLQLLTTAFTYRAKR
jgi:hypothetical protein